MNSAIHELMLLTKNSATLLKATARIQNAKRTCDLILGVGDGNSDTFSGFQYSPHVANVIKDTNLAPVNASWHPPIENVVYVSSLSISQLPIATNQPVPTYRECGVRRYLPRLASLILLARWSLDLSQLEVLTSTPPSIFT